MAELLVRVVGKVNPGDARKDAKLTKRGDVIVVMPDKYQWGDVELTHPEWRILRWPALSLSEASVFLTPELPTEPAALDAIPDPMLQRRGFHLNVDLPALPADFRAYLDDATRARPWYNVPDKVKLAQIKKQRPKRADPTVIG